MKFRPKEALIALTAAVAGTGVAMIIFRMPLVHAAPYGISILVFWVIFSSRKNFELDTKDERMVKLSRFCMSLSWMFTLFAVMTIYWIDYFRLASVTVSAFVFLVMVAMVGSFWIFRLIFAKKGDIE